MSGFVVRDERELDELLGRIADPADEANSGPILVQVVLSRTDYPEAIAYAMADCGKAHPASVPTSGGERPPPEVP